MEHKSSRNTSQPHSLAFATAKNVVGTPFKWNAGSISNFSHYIEHLVGRNRFANKR
jgi:hypothetical protein